MLPSHRQAPRLRSRLATIACSATSRARTTPMEPGAAAGHLASSSRSAPIAGTRWASAPPATREQVLRVHHPLYVEAVDAARGVAFDLDPDVLLSAGSVDAAYLAAGAGIAAVEAVVSGAARRAFALVRPPGHHAERPVGMTRTGTADRTRRACPRRHPKATTTPSGPHHHRPVRDHHGRRRSRSRRAVRADLEVRRGAADDPRPGRARRATCRAAATITSGVSACSWAASVPSRTLTGWLTGTPRRSAASLTAGGISLRPRPAGLSGCCRCSPAARSHVRRTGGSLRRSSGLRTAASPVTASAAAARERAARSTAQRRQPR